MSINISAETKVRIAMSESILYMNYVKLSIEIRGRRAYAIVYFSETKDVNSVLFIVFYVPFGKCPLYIVCSFSSSTYLFM